MNRTFKSLSCIKTLLMLIVGIFLPGYFYGGAGNSIYIGDTGKEGARVQEMQQEFIAKDSYAHLENAGLSEGQIVWDIGCGNGCMTEYLAKKVGKQGHVYAVDSSSEMLDRAKQRVKSAGLENVTFIQGDITSMNLPEKTADLVYSRFIFMHLQNPKAVMGKVLSMLKPEGVLTLQESALKEAYASRPVGGLEEFIDAIIRLGKSKGLDFNLGEKLEYLCKKVGFQAVKGTSKTHKLSARTASEILKIRLLENGSKMLQAGVATQLQVDKWKKIPDQLDQFAADPSFYIVPGKMYFVLAWKGASS